MNTWNLCQIFCALLWHLGSCESLTSNDIVQPDLDCAFTPQEGMCGWEDTSLSHWLRWTLDRGGIQHTGPKRDHTTGFGYYLSMRTGQVHETGKAILASPQVVTNKETCLSLWYCMHGFQMGNLNVYKISQGNETTKLFSMSGPQGPRWYRADIKTGGGEFTLMIEGTFPQLGDFGDIAIDDITFSYQPCEGHDTGVTKDEPHFDCDFEDDLCSWYSYNNNDIEWQLYTVPFGIQPRDAFPPQSNGSSYAILHRFRSGVRVGLDLTSPAMSLEDNETCMTFWLKMEGQMASFFFVYTVEYRHKPHPRTKTLFSTVQKTGGWVQVFVTLPKAKHFFVSLRGESEQWSYGKIKVDDIRLTRNEPCPKVNQEHLINCDFDKDFCRWYMTSKTTVGDWLRTKDPTPTNGTGPSHDHSENGYFIFLDGADVDVANLFSPLFNVGDGGACLRFWYYMYGEDVYRLELVYKSYGDDEDLIWSLEGSQADRWIQQNVSIPSSRNVSLLFTAKRGYFPKSDIALDDISITFGAPCGNEKVPTTASPSSIIHEETTVPPTTHTSSPSTEPPPIKTPQLIAKGEINPAYENSHVELVCQQPDPSLIIKWFKQKEFSTHADDFEEIVERFGESFGKSRLVFDEIQMRNMGTYMCTVTRDLKLASETSKSNTVEINVVRDPRASPVLEIEGDIAHVRGRNIDLEVNAAVKLICGHPSDGAVYLWKTSSAAFADSTLPSTRFLVLNDTKTEHSGSYSCRITKDGLSTSKSNFLNLFVKKGKWCLYSHQCAGAAYVNSCGYDHRCRCKRNAVLDGRACKVRPTQPTIVTSPGYQEFGVGESFYVICQPGAPVLNNLTFTLHFHDSIATTEDQPNVSPLRILKISDASVKNSGSYVCTVSYDNVESYYSDEITVQVKDFIDLSCDFTYGFCGWSLGHDIGTTEFVAASSSEVSTQDRSGAFIQLVASTTSVPNRAILVSPTIERMTLDSCLSFWYRMNGPEVHSLSVWKFSSQMISNDEFEYVGTEVWTEVGEKGNNWIRQNVTIERGNNFYVTFDAIGRAAIDDVIFTYRGGCKDE